VQPFTTTASRSRAYLALAQTFLNPMQLETLEKQGSISATSAGCAVSFQHRPAAQGYDAFFRIINTKVPRWTARLPEAQGPEQYHKAGPIDGAVVAANRRRSRRWCGDNLHGTTYHSR